ncbi:MAG TPA: LysR family transcriptional regulator [Granulicella sp.]|jgi:DNA-binding transcriptional LysR family regulator
MNLSDLEAFAAVVESGSIVGAAGRLYLTQSAVTKRIQNLEGALDVILLDRQSRPMRPTQLGKKVYDHAETILAAVAAMKTAVVHNGEASGEFNLGVAPGLGEAVVTPLFETLCRHFPKLVPHVFAQNTKVLVERLISGSIVAGVLLCSEGNDPPDTLVTEVVGKLPYVLVGSAAFPSDHLSTIADLAQQPWVVGTERCAARHYLDRTFKHYGMPLRIMVETESKDSQLLLAAQGTGLAVVPSYLVDASPARPDLRVLEVEEFDASQNVWIAYSRYLGSQEKAIPYIRETIVEHLESLGS